MSDNPFDWLQQGGLGSSMQKALSNREGWGGLDEQDADAAQAEMKAAQETAQSNADQLIYDVLVTGPRGPEFFEMLEQSTVMQPTFVPGVVDTQFGAMALPAEQQGFIREGQNSMYQHFKAAIARHEQRMAAPPAPQPEEET